MFTVFDLAISSVILFIIGLFVGNLAASCNAEDSFKDRNCRYCKYRIAAKSNG